MGNIKCEIIYGQLNTRNRARHHTFCQLNLGYWTQCRHGACLFLVSGDLYRFKSDSHHFRSVLRFLWVNVIFLYNLAILEGLERHPKWIEAELLLKHFQDCHNYLLLSKNFHLNFKSEHHIFLIFWKLILLINYIIFSNFKK